jgi:hypothetical protein
MYWAANGLSWLVGLAELVCFILVLVNMFQAGQTGLGVACIVLALCGIGFLIAFIMGWINAGAWKIQNIMLIWTGCIVVNLILAIVMVATAPKVPGGGFGPRVQAPVSHMRSL